MADGHPRLGAVVEALYNREDPGSRWGGVTTALSSILGASTVRITAISKQSGEVLLDALTPDWPPALQVEYDKHYREADPRIDAALSRIGTTVACTDLPDQRAYANSPLVCDLLGRPDIDARWGILHISDAYAGIQMLVGACRNRKAGPFERSDRQDFDAALRYIGHALELETRIMSLDSEKRALEASLDAVSVPTIVVTQDMRVLHMNAPATKLTGVDKGFRLKSGRLVAARACDQDALEILVRNADELRDGVPHPTNTAVIGSGDGPPMLVRAYALPRSSFVEGQRGRQYVLTLATGKRPADQGLDALLESFRLTLAEQRLVQHLLLGSTLASAATEFGVSIETVRSQLKSAREKVGVRRQADLLGLLARYQH